jgi:hypothetical protein
LVRICEDEVACEVEATSAHGRREACSRNGMRHFHPCVPTAVAYRGSRFVPHCGPPHCARPPCATRFVRMGRCTRRSPEPDCFVSSRRYLLLTSLICVSRNTSRVKGQSWVAWGAGVVHSYLNLHRARTPSRSVAVQRTADVRHWTRHQPAL